LRQLTGVLCLLDWIIAQLHASTSNCLQVGHLKLKAGGKWTDPVESCEEQSCDRLNLWDIGIYLCFELM
jgi:hypothetical protein